MATASSGPVMPGISGQNGHRLPGLPGLRAWRSGIRTAQRAIITASPGTVPGSPCGHSGHTARVSRRPGTPAAARKAAHQRREDRGSGHAKADHRIPHHTIRARANFRDNAQANQPPQTRTRITRLRIRNATYRAALGESVPAPKITAKGAAGQDMTDVTGSWWHPALAVAAASPGQWIYTENTLARYEPGRQDLMNAVTGDYLPAAMRASDADRDAVLSDLSQHFQAGRQADRCRTRRADRAGADRPDLG
jgi:hypothetical protein